MLKSFLILGILLSVSGTGLASDLCRKSMIAKSHQQMNEKLFLPFDSLLKETTREVAEASKDALEITLEQWSEFQVKIEKLSGLAIKIRQILNQMILKTDHSLHDIQLMQKDPEYYQDIKSKMLLYAGHAVEALDMMAITFEELKSLEAITSSELSQQFEEINNRYADLNEAAMHGHYKIH